MLTPNYITAAVLTLIWAIISAAMPCSATSLEQERTTELGKFRVTQWNSEHGLPQNTVTAILQSRQGYLWIGTRYGLARYDGVRLSDYSAELGQANENDLEVRGMAEDTEGRLWLHSKTDLVCIESGRFERVPPEVLSPGSSIIRIKSSRKGGVWVLTSPGLFRLQKRTPGNFSRTESGPVAPNEETAIADFFEDLSTNLWFAAICNEEKNWMRLRPGSEVADYATNVFHRPGLGGGVLRMDRQGTMWLARTNSLTRISSSGEFHEIPADKAWGTNGVQDVVEDARGNLWILSYGDVQLFRYSDHGFTSFGPAAGLRHSSDLRCLCPDREGNVWAGSGAGGFYRVQERKLLSILTGFRTAHDEVYSISTGANGRTWLATPYGLVKHEAGSLSFYTNNSTEPHYNFSRVRPVFEHSSGEVLFGLDFLGLHRLTDGKFERLPFPKTDPYARRCITSFCEGVDRTVWMATPVGLVERRGESWKLWGKEHGLTDERTSGLVAVPDGSVWVGTRNGGVCRFRDGRFQALTRTNGLLSDNAWPLRWETNGVLWVGTPAGINRVRSDEVRSITRREGLFDNLAYCLIDDSRGNFWSFGNRGIWKVAQSDMNQVADGLATHVHAVAYGEADGMPSAEGNGDDQPNAVPVANGDLWFPTTHGVVIVNTDRLPSNEVRPSVVIEQVVVDDTVVYRDGFYPMANGVTYPAGGGLRIRPGIGKVVELHYTANTFIAPEGTHFRYRLRGDSTDWREAGTRRQAFYTGLEPGDYLFEVEARNHDGVWSEHPVRFPFRLEPHFYQTWPFYIATGLAAIGLLGTLHTRRLNEARRLQELQQDQALHEERSRIAKDLHDDLGANLTGLALKVEVARRQLDDRSGAEAQLRAAAEAIRSLVERMREVIWSLNPQCDTLESFRAYCCQYAENFLAAAGLRCRFEMPVNVPEVMLSAQERHHLLLVIKEALNNTARHARATEARIGLRYVRGLLVLTLADNGRGFLASASSPLDEGGNGLLNMRRRVESVGGKFELESQIGLGTTIRITVPLPTTR